MDYDRLKHLILAVFAAILFAVVCHIAGRVQGRRIGWEQGYAEGFEAGYESPHPADTIFTRDTLVIDRPVYVTKEKVRTELVAVHDTLRLADTLYMPVEIEARKYAGEDYEAQVSGWHPALDYIKVYPTTQTITQYIVKEQPRFVFGITAGPAAVWDIWEGKPHAGVGVVAGLTIRIGK